MTGSIRIDCGSDGVWAQVCSHERGGTLCGLRYGAWPFAGLEPCSDGNADARTGQLGSLQPEANCPVERDTPELTTRKVLTRVIMGPQSWQKNLPSMGADISAPKRRVLPILVRGSEVSEAETCWLHCSMQFLLYPHQSSRVEFSKTQSSGPSPYPCCELFFSRALCGGRQCTGDLVPLPLED